MSFPHNSTSRRKDVARSLAARRRLNRLVRRTNAEIEPLEQRVLMTIWYATGAAGNTGNGSMSSPWSSFALINSNLVAHNISSGDTVMLAGTFNQPNQVLNVSAGITVTSSASSPAVIAEPSSWNATSAIHVTAGNVTISNLNLSGPGIGTSSTNVYGVYFDDSTASTNYSNVTISNVTAVGFVQAGIAFVGNNKYGFDNVTIGTCNASNNQVSGIYMADAVGAGNLSTPAYDFSNVTIYGCTTDNNTGYQT